MLKKQNLKKKKFALSEIKIIKKINFINFIR